MRVIAGHVSWTGAEGAAPPVVRAMVDSVPGARSDLSAVPGPAAFWTSGETEQARLGDGLLVVADLELSNSDELDNLAGSPGSLGLLLARLYREEGPHFVRRLRGAFALAIWDPDREQLLVAVDHFGIKRLYYTSNAERAAFATRPGLLTRLPGVGRSVDLGSVYSYLNFGFVPAPRSIFAGVLRLPPGHLGKLRADGPSVEPYWDMAYAERPMRTADAAGMVYRLTEQAVADALRDISPKEMGAYLSGGTDSSTVVGLASRLTGERIQAFSVGFSEERYDELEYAKITARRFDAAHYTRILGPDQALASLPRLVEAYEEPSGNNSAIGALACAEAARECGVRRLLAGDGGDEIFGGNERYRTDRIYARYDRVPAIFRRALLEPALSRVREDSPSLLGRARRYVRRANLPNPERYYFSEFLFARAAEELLGKDVRDTVSKRHPYAILETHYRQARATAELNRLMYIDLKVTLGDNDLLKVTRTAELAGVAVRFPFLSLPLVEFTGTMPARFKLRGLEKRYLFKQAFGPLLAPETLAKRKHGFGVPTSAWLKAHAGFRELARDTLLSPRARQRGYLRRGAVEWLFERHEADRTPYYGDILWNVLMLELWQRQHLDGVAAA
jgi:asparagine synthase (glutamine-hydrolysing)